MHTEKTALISVYHKDGIVEFAKRLIALGWRLLASGGTARHLGAAGVVVTDVADKVGEPILGHRVVTLSREVHAGLLAKDTPEDSAELKRLGIDRIGLVCVDLYPLENAIAKPDATLTSVLELMDIGGPTMLSSASKGEERIVICDPADRESVLAMLESRLPFDGEFREHLAAKADFVVSKYRMLTTRYRGKGAFEAIHGTHFATCLYGENAYQTPAALYSTNSDDPLALDKFQLVDGKPMGYNNWCDLDRALQTITHIAAGLEVNTGEFPLMAVGVKHGNPCGVSYGIDWSGILQQVIEGDQLAIMGGLIMTNFTIREEQADVLLTHKMPTGKRRLIDVIAARSFSPEALGNLKRKGDKCRMVANEELIKIGLHSLDTAPRFRYVRGGFLKQPNYTYVPNFSDGSVVCHGAPRLDLVPDLVLAWAIGSTSNSNTVTLVKYGMLIGNGVGQQDRVGAAELAIARARRSGHDIKDAVAYSDSFFPFDDGPRTLVDAGVDAIFTSSGSVHDNDTIALCKERGVTLYMVPDKIGRGFYGH